MVTTLDAPMSRNDSGETSPREDQEGGCRDGATRSGRPIAMTAAVSGHLISDLSCFIHSRTGLHFPRERWPALMRGIHEAAKDLGFAETEACIRYILSAPLSVEELNVIVGHLTVGETYFFRDPEVFDTLRHRILTPLAKSGTRGRRHLRIWSAACSTGEEPYSIAMLLDQMAGLFQGWKITLLATDINRRFIDKAEKGIYTTWSFRRTPKWIRDRYFTKIGKNRYEIAPPIRKMVTFSQLNLIEEGSVLLPEEGCPADLIFCRNVLLYLSPEMRSRVLQRVSRTLADDGWLIVSPSEIPFVEGPELHQVRFPEAVFHRKGPRGGAVTGPATNTQPPGSPVNVDHTEETVPPPPRPTASIPPRKRPPAPSPPIPEHKGKPRQIAYMEASALYDRALYEEVVARLEPLMTDDADVGDSRYPADMAALLAKAYANLGRLQDAKKWGEKAVGIDKLNPDYAALLAAVYHEMGLAREAVVSLKRVIYLEPRRIMAHLMLGHLMRQEGKTRDARRSFAAALDLLSSMDPEETVPHSDGLKAGRLAETVRLMVSGD